MPLVALSAVNVSHFFILHQQLVIMKNEINDNVLAHQSEKIWVHN
jgi:hypothetical protein